MNAHTPGPWECTPSRVYRMISGPHGLPIGCTFGARDDARSEMEDIYNARLITAAPDLLAALCDMLSNRANLSPATIDRARMAIVKAGGPP